MAEIEYKGIKVGGSKLLLILPLIGTLIGGLWGGFEVYQRYIIMEKKINSFVSPDLSGYDKRIELIQQQLNMLQNEIPMIFNLGGNKVTSSSEIAQKFLEQACK